MGTALPCRLQTGMNCFLFDRIVYILKLNYLAHVSMGNLILYLM